MHLIKTNIFSPHVVVVVIRNTHTVLEYLQASQAQINEFDIFSFIKFYH